MKNVTLVTENLELDNRVPWNEKWYGTFESDVPYEEGQEMDFNSGGLTGKAIITEVHKDGRTYSYVGNGQLNAEGRVGDGTDR